MAEAGKRPFIGSEALRAGTVTWHEPAKYYRVIMPDVYLGRRAELTMRRPTLAAWLWSHRQAVHSHFCLVHAEAAAIT